MVLPLATLFCSLVEYCVRTCFAEIRAGGIFPRFVRTGAPVPLAVAGPEVHADAIACADAAGEAAHTIRRAGVAGPVVIGGGAVGIIALGGYEGGERQQPQRRAHRAKHC